MDIVYAIWLRGMKKFFRSRSRIIGSIAMPLFMYLFLGLGLNNVVQIPELGGDYLQFLIPGMVALTVMFTAVGSGSLIIWDKQFGILKETLVAPVTRLEIMVGQTSGGTTMAVLQGLFILLPALLIGLRVPALPGFFIVVLFMVLIGSAFTAFGIALASGMENMTGFQLLSNFLTFLIFGLSGAIFPICSLPPLLAPLTLLDPLTYGVEGMRFGLTGVSQIHPAVCFAVMCGFCMATTAAGAYLFRKAG